MGRLGPKAGNRLPSAGGSGAPGAPAQGRPPGSYTSCQAQEHRSSRVAMVRSGWMYLLGVKLGKGRRLYPAAGGWPGSP